MQTLEIERLIREVTALVLSALETKASGSPQGLALPSRGPSSAPRSSGRPARGSNDSLDPGAARRRPRRLILLAPVSTPTLAKLAETSRALSFDGWNVRSFAAVDVLAEARDGGPSAALPDLVQLSAASVSELITALRPGDCLVLGSLAFGLAGRLSRLEDDDPFVRVIVSARLRGLPVLVVRDDLEPAAGISGEIVRRASSLLRDLEQLGLDVLPSEDLANRLERLSAGRSVAARTVGGLVTETEVERLHESGERRLVLPPRTLVTPLARSRAAALGFELIEKGRD